MKKENGKKELMDAAICLLLEAAEPEKITSRQITEKAGANLAMINYYYESKDQLLRLAVGKIIESSAEHFRSQTDAGTPPRQRLKEMLSSLCEEVVKYQVFTKVYIPYVLTQDDILTPYYILPILKEYFGDARTETECKIMAYEMISFFQLVFLRADAFYQYTGIDLQRQEERSRMIDRQLDLFLGGN